MFVKNKENLDFKYRKNGYLALLKANTVSYVDETKVTAKELLACYGQRIDIISRELAIEIAPSLGDTKSKAPKAPKKVETVKKSDLNDSFIEQILGEIEGEADKDKNCEGNCDSCVDRACGKEDKSQEKIPSDDINVYQEFINEKVFGMKPQPKGDKEEDKSQEGTKAPTPKAPTKAKATKAKTTKPRAKRGSKAKKA